MKNVYRRMINFCLTGMLYFVCAMNVYAEDVLAEPTKNLFDTILNTGLNLLLATEIIYAGYLFSTGKERTLKTWSGLVIIMLITAYAKVKLGGGK